MRRIRFLATCLAAISIDVAVAQESIPFKLVALSNTSSGGLLSVQTSPFGPFGYEDTPILYRSSIGPLESSAHPNTNGLVNIATVGFTEVIPDLNPDRPNTTYVYSSRPTLRSDVVYDDVRTSEFTMVLDKYRWDVELTQEFASDKNVFEQTYRISNTGDAQRELTAFVFLDADLAIGGALTENFGSRAAGRLSVIDRGGGSTHATEQE